MHVFIQDGPSALRHYETAFQKVYSGEASAADAMAEAAKEVEKINEEEYKKGVLHQPFWKQTEWRSDIMSEKKEND